MALSTGVGSKVSPAAGMDKKPSIIGNRLMNERMLLPRTSASVSGRPRSFPLPLHFKVGERGSYLDIKDIPWSLNS